MLPNSTLNWNWEIENLINWCLYFSRNPTVQGSYSAEICAYFILILQTLHRLYLFWDTWKIQLTDKDHFNLPPSSFVDLSTLSSPEFEKCFKSQKCVRGSPSFGENYTDKKQSLNIQNYKLYGRLGVKLFTLFINNHEIKYNQFTHKHNALIPQSIYRVKEFKLSYFKRIFSCSFEPVLNSYIYMSMSGGSAPSNV